MKVITLVPGSIQISISDRQEPQITSPGQIKIAVLQVGICGTDRDEAAGGRAEAPEGRRLLVTGHEMFGKVVETGAGVTAAAIGEYGLFTVRRGCGECLACLNGRNDLCYTGHYLERGIKGEDGYQAEYVVDDQRWFVPVPAAQKAIGVLTEPMSIASKAIDEALAIQGERLKDIVPSVNWLEGRRALVAGLGPVGLLAAFALRLRGADVIGIDIVDEDSVRPFVLKQAGGRYIDGRKVPTKEFDDLYGEVDFVFEATGIAKLQVQLTDTLGMNGIYVATGIPSGSRPLSINAGDLMRQLVMKNQVILGSVNASIAHYHMAVADLGACEQRWPGLAEKLITKHLPYTQFEQALRQHEPEDIKVVVEWNDQK